MAYLNGYTLDCTTYPRRRRPAHITCADSGICVCGFCKGEGQCDLGDCADNATGRCTACGRLMCAACHASGTHAVVCRAPSTLAQLAVYDRTTYGATDDGDPTGGGPYLPGSAIES
jgi:hypothetical protein